MANKITQSRLRKVLKKTAEPQTGWLDVFPAVIGKADGTVQTGAAGIIYIRNLLNGQVLTVYNFVAPNTAGLQVDVGRKVETPGLWQVKGVREAYAIPAGGSVSAASHTHNDLFITHDRFLPFLVFPIAGSGFEVRIYADALLKGNGKFGYVVNQTLDLASYVPTDGTAKWVVIEADEDGNIYVNEGASVAAKELLTPAEIPTVTWGRVASCAIRLYDGQEQLYRDPNSINDFIDLRVPALRVNISNLDDLLDVNAFEPDDGDVLTYDAFYGMWVASPPTSGGVTWGSITGTLANQTDLFSSINGVVQKSINDAPSDTIADADLLGFLDASDSYILKKFGYSDLKTSLNNQYLKRDSTSNWSELAGTPSTPAAGGWKVYPKSGGLFTLNSAGTETQLGDMLKADNLSGLTNAATARTNLGLVAGGAGDIWVEKAGDTMTGKLVINKSYSDDLGSLTAQETNVTQTPTNTSASYRSVIGNLVQATINTNYNITSGDVVGLGGYATKDGSGTFAGVYGLNFVAQNLGTGNLNSLYGVWTATYNSNATAIVSNAYGIAIASAIATGQITNLYGLYINDVTLGTTINTAIRTGKGLLSFGDRVSITNSASAANIALQIKGAASQTGDLLKIINSSNSLLYQQTSDGVVTIKRRTNNVSGRDPVLNIWGGTTADGSGPALTFFTMYSDISYPNWDMGSIAGVYNSADGGWAGNLVFYVNRGSAESNYTEIMRLRPGGLTIGSGFANLDYYIKVDGETNDGFIYWMEDEDYWKFNDDIFLTDAENVILGTTTGSKIGTSTSQKLGLWNATPIVQPTTAIAAATFVANTSGIVDDSATFDGYTIGQVVKALRNLGVLA